MASKTLYKTNFDAEEQLTTWKVIKLPLLTQC